MAECLREPKRIAAVNFAVGLNMRRRFRSSLPIHERIVAQYEMLCISLMTLLLENMSRVSGMCLPSEWE